MYLETFVGTFLFLSIEEEIYGSLSLSFSLYAFGWPNERFEPPLLPRCFRSGTLFISDTRNSLVRYYIEFPALQLNDTARLSTWHYSPFFPFLPCFVAKRIAPFSPSSFSISSRSTIRIEESIYDNVIRKLASDYNAPLETGGKKIRPTSERNSLPFF